MRGSVQRAGARRHTSVGAGVAGLARIAVGRNTTLHAREVARPTERVPRLTVRVAEALDATTAQGLTLRHHRRTRCAAGRAGMGRRHRGWRRRRRRRRTRGGARRRVGQEVDRSTLAFEQGHGRHGRRHQPERDRARCAHGPWRAAEPRLPHGLFLLLDASIWLASGRA
jgi:hypothetical protein